MILRMLSSVISSPVISPTIEPSFMTITRLQLTTTSDRSSEIMITARPSLAVHEPDNEYPALLRHPHLRLTRIKTSRSLLEPLERTIFCWFPLDKCRSKFIYIILSSCYGKISSRCSCIINNILFLILPITQRQTLQRR